MIPYRQTGGLGWLGDGLLTKAKDKFQLVEYEVNAIRKYLVVIWEINDEL